MNLKTVISKKPKIFCWPPVNHWRRKRSGSVSKRQGSADPDPCRTKMSRIQNTILRLLYFRKSSIQKKEKTWHLVSATSISCMFSWKKEIRLVTKTEYRKIMFIYWPMGTFISSLSMTWNDDLRYLEVENALAHQALQEYSVFIIVALFARHLVSVKINSLTWTQALAHCFPHERTEVGPSKSVQEMKSVPGSLTGLLGHANQKIWKIRPMEKKWTRLLSKFNDNRQELFGYMMLRFSVS